VWSEEIIATKIAACSRIYNERTDTVEFMGKAGGHAVFQTMPSRERVVFQIGSSNAADALRAAEVVARDVVAIDINMGCNKHAAVSCGMGAALAQNPAAAADLVKSIARNIPCPITAKIRLQQSPKRTLDLVKALELSGAAAVVVHCRTREQGPAHAGDWAALAPIVQSACVPIIGNGDVWDVETALAMLRSAGDSTDSAAASRGDRMMTRHLGGIMLGRGALRDCRQASRTLQYLYFSTINASTSVLASQASVGAGKKAAGCLL
jgi:tRNA-dihydrouridine synthase 2